MIVLSWLSGNPRRLKVYVGNRVSNIIHLVPPNCWQHVTGVDNSASRGQFPTELLEKELWWNGPAWLWLSESQWPRQPTLEEAPVPAEEKEIALIVSSDVLSTSPIVERFSSFTRLCHVTTWIFRFVKKTCSSKTSHLTVDEICHAERYWISVSQQSAFPKESLCLKKSLRMPSKSPLLFLHPMPSWRKE